jgi:hypothetical protein
VPATSNIWRYEHNIFLGQPSAYRDGQRTALDWYSDGAFNGSVQYVDNIVWNVKHGKCPVDSICKDPRLRDESLARFDPRPMPGSPAIGAAHAANGESAPRPNIGAVQPSQSK